MSVQDIREIVYRWFYAAPSETVERSTWYAVVRQLGSLTDGNKQAHRYLLEEAARYTGDDCKRSVYLQVLALFDN